MSFDSFEQVPFGAESFAENPDPRCACVLLLDVSGSMAGAPISELNAGIQLFKDELLSDPLAARRVETAIVTFGPVKLETTFQTANNLYLPTFQASGDTPIGSAIQMGVEILNQRKNDYRNNGIQYYRPWIILITDGEPTDSWQGSAELIKKGESDKAFSFFCIGVSSANMSILKQISVREPLPLKGYSFKEFFLWLSSSLKRVSESVVGTNVPLLPPHGWAEV
jgi:uncharacterized protein YegL